MTNQNEHSEALFESLRESKEARKRKRRKTVITALAIIGVALIAGVLLLRSMVTERFGGNAAEVLSYTAARSTISTTVSGTGSLTGVDAEAIVLPAGVEVTEIVVRAGETVAAGDVLATVNMSTVIGTLAELQAELDALDEALADAEGDKVSGTIKAGVTGRVKAVYPEKSEDIAACMVDHGALAVISLDGYMAFDLTTDALSKGDTMAVTLSDGSAVSGTVESAVGGTAVVLISDNGPAIGDEVTASDSEGSVIGSGVLYVHNPLSVTGVAGTVSSIHVQENAKVFPTTTLFTLKDTDYSANYETLLRQRGELEEQLLQLLRVYRDGAVTAAFDGTVSSVDFTEEADEETETDVAVVTVYPNERMSVTIGVDEADILSLELGQEAAVTVSSVNEDAFTGSVTEISKAADTSSGVTMYSAVIELDYAAGMLMGMSAEAVVNIEGVENAIIVPVDAVHRTSAVSYVYTTYDEKSGTYGGMTEVVTGLSNDSYIEIISGLEEGTTVYYTESVDDFFFGMGGNRGGFGSGVTVSVDGNSMPNMGGQRPDMPNGGRERGG